MSKEALAARQTGTAQEADARAVAELAAQAGLEKKAADVYVVDVRGLAGYADFLVLMSAASERQVGAVADAVDDQLRRAGHRPLGVEGGATGNWVLLDAGDVVVHVFHEHARSFYDLDGLWADAQRTRVEDRTPAAMATPA